MAYAIKVKNIINELNQSFIEKDELIKLLLLAVFADQPIFLYGTTGTAKRSIVKHISSAFTDSQFFSYLIHPSSNLGEIGHNSVLKDLKNLKSAELSAHNNQQLSNYKSNKSLQSSLLKANFIFLDEVWQSSSVILNTLLAILNHKLDKSPNSIDSTKDTKIESFNHLDKNITNAQIRLIFSSSQAPSSNLGLVQLYDRLLLGYEVLPIQEQENFIFRE